MGLGAVELLVTPEKLTIASNDMSNSLNRMQDCIAELDQIINSSGVYWQGEAADCLREIFSKEKPAIDEAIERLKEHPRDLIEIAGNYIDTEALLESMAEELPSDVIS